MEARDLDGPPHGTRGLALDPERLLEGAYELQVEVGIRRRLSVLEPLRLQGTRRSHGAGG